MLPLHLNETVSARPGISPGIVENHERLLRALFNPDHVKDGKVLVTAISLKDLRHRGFSVHRMAYVSPHFVQGLIDKFLSRPAAGGQQREFEGVAPLETRAVREISEDGKQVFVVIDTAKCCNVGHSSIYLSDAPSSEGRARKLRALLLPLLQERMSLDEAFNRSRP